MHGHGRVPPENVGPGLHHVLTLLRVLVRSGTQAGQGRAHALPLRVRRTHDAVTQAPQLIGSDCFELELPEGRFGSRSYTDRRMSLVDSAIT